MRLVSRPREASYAHMLSVGDEIEVEILRVSSGGGRGVSKHEGIVIFTPNTAPEDVARVQITKVKKSFAEAVLVEVISPSPHRMEPPCPVFEDCGGCTLQMLKISEQHKQKEGFLEFAVNSVFKNQKTAFSILPIQGSQKAFRYRNRIQLHQEGKRLGFYKKGSHKLVRIDDCLITDERITAKFKDLKVQNRKRRIEIAVTKAGQIVKSEKALGPEQALFSQVNESLNKVLIQFVIDEAKKLQDLMYIQDLYCGSGNFSFPFAKSFENAKVTGVELSKASVQMANERNVLDNLKFIASDVSKYLKRISKNNKKADLILVDPPRKGMDKSVVDEILKSEVRDVFYISCDLSSATRDLRILSEKYDLVLAKPFDMFPQTDHLESFFRLQLVD